MEAKRVSAFAVVAILSLSLLILAAEANDAKTEVKMVKHKKLCRKTEWECNKWSEFCCNQTISDIFQVYQFENLFSKRNSPVAHAVGFWDYQSFIIAANIYEPLGFGTTGGKLMQMKEIAAFLGHVGCKTSCKPSSSLIHILVRSFYEDSLFSIPTLCPKSVGASRLLRNLSYCGWNSSIEVKLI